MSDSALHMHLSLHKHIHVSSLKALPTLPLAIAAMQVICTLTHITSTWCTYIIMLCLKVASLASYQCVVVCACIGS